MPFTVAQHSMQTPMAHSGFRGSPETDLRVATPACISAAAILAPCGTDMSFPLTVSSTVASAACAEFNRGIGVGATLIVTDFVYCARSRQKPQQLMTAHLNPSRRIEVIDSHTAGEPTRCILSGAPDLGKGSLAERMARLRRDHDSMRRALLCEPRGSDVVVGAWLLEPDTPDCVAAVIFFNNVGYLGMCGHGTIGVAATLAHLGRIKPGIHFLQTPVGKVKIDLHSSNNVTIENVPAYRYVAGARVHVPGHGTVVGDVAWGGNWFFLVEHHGLPLELENVDALTELSWKIRTELPSIGATGADGAEIDHIELFTGPHNPTNHSRNFVLCPGRAYDRSPCGTGTSAKMACLLADGKLTPGEVWRQEGILGTVFEGRVRIDRESIIPSITGSSYVTAESTLIFDPGDPFRAGIGS
jgi:4-hydroxyproline epimerase